MRDVPDDVPVADEMIRLGQFLKLAGVVDTGGEIKALLASGVVRVNGEVDEHRGRQLHRGDVVAVGTARMRVTRSD